MPTNESPRDMAVRVELLAVLGDLTRIVDTVRADEQEQLRRHMTPAGQ